jgi:hypothetical protein
MNAALMSRILWISAAVAARSTQFVRVNADLGIRSVDESADVR